MSVVFYVSGAIAIVATAMAISRLNAVHALLYLVVSLLSVAVVFYTLGAPFVAALEVIIYAGAIMVLFVFVTMMLNLGPESVRQEERWLEASTWFGPTVLALALLGELLYIIALGAPAEVGVRVVDPKEVGILLYGPYLLGVELASLVLLAGLVGAYHLGRREPRRESGRRER